MSEQFFAEDQTDVWLANSGLLPETGVYVDAGCAHPWRYSQTAFLRNRGWTGIAIDADPAYAPEWEGIAGAKFVNALLSNRPAENFLIEPTNALVSRVHELGKLTPAFSLQQILDVHGILCIDFLALDLEGMEIPVLFQFLTRLSINDSPKFIICEFNSCHRGRNPMVFNLLINNPQYHLVHLTDSNAVFAL